ncbi:SusC/RagA family TonB-linked outer membrane protein [Anditalea andensis]|uniref:TonB-dependent receptor n=1 Tax=Anditalea andensis TaxID=1048983 RepID=A0A074L752_9BACT|nr:SusC/RagA family TonB-linked outer membrane protein [Anditalea andensis]KEO75653.1 TonB-dependent receptor [Anditalea andensis]
MKNIKNYKYQKLFAKTSTKTLFTILFLLISLHIHAQERIRVVGVVADDKGELLPGVSILEKGTTNGTVSDLEGKFTMEVASPQSVLIFSFIGLKNVERTVGSQTSLNIRMDTDSQNLDEFVVIGYGTQRRKEITSSVATVSVEEFNQGGVRSPLDLIQGKVAGLSVTRTAGNNPNSSASIQLRGVTSLTGNLEPLIVIDGIPGGNLDLLQQDDIASFDVLKDGSAAAIYGTRGNNGVILITTKRGKSGDPTFEYSNYFQREVIDRRPDIFDAAGYRELIAQGVIAEGNDRGGSSDLYEELLNRNNLSQYHNFAASGGNANTNYRVSLYYNEAQGIAKQNTREQIGGRININHRGLNGKLLLQTNVATNFNNANLLGGRGEDGRVGDDFEQAVQRNPTDPLFHPDGSFVETEASGLYNPLSRLAYRINERNQHTFSADAKMTYEIFEGLNISAFGAHQRNTWNDRQYRGMNDFTQRPNQQYQGTGYAYKRNLLNWQNTFESTLDYKRVMGDHRIDFVGGYSFQYFTEEIFDVNNSGFTTDAFLDWNLGAGSAINNTVLPRPGMGSSKQDNTLIALFGRASYAYKDRYFAQFTLRREGSSRFGVNNKWGNFPAVSVGWDIAEEGFMSAVSQINIMKLRVGYGVTGNQGIPNYQSLITLGTGGVYPQEGVFYQTYGPSRNPNPDLKWERKQEWNFGLDFSLFNNRITGALDVYNRQTVDLLYNYIAQQPPYIHSNIYTNVGTINNRGVELFLSGNVMKKADFSWNMDFAANSQFNMLSTLTNDVYSATFLEFGGLPNPGNLGNAIRLVEGGTVGNFFGKRFAGFSEDGKWRFFKADGSIVSASEISEEDLTVIGNGVPRYMASWTNNFRYKNFDLTLFFRGKFGFDILNTQELYFGNKSWLPNNMLRSALTTHAELNDTPQYSDYYLERGDFVKLDNVTLGYNFNIVSNYVRNLRVYVTGRNLLTFTGYSGLDPEIQDTGFTTGIDSRSFYPRTNSYTIGLNVGF